MMDQIFIINILFNNQDRGFQNITQIVVFMLDQLIIFYQNLRNKSRLIMQQISFQNILAVLSPIFYLNQQFYFHAEKSDCICKYMGFVILIILQQQMVLKSFSHDILLFVIFVSTVSKCVYSQSDQELPYVYDGDSFDINYTMTACQQYIGDKVCCNEYNAKLTADNLKQVDGAFSSASGGCDICAINLKRLWCQYACSPRQADFLKVSKQYYVYPDPQRPGKTITAQEANLTVQASTACAIYQSCKRLPFVTSVSAMGSPAGFLNFQGHNAIDNARQYISVFFTYNKSEGLYFGNDSDTTPDKNRQITSCNYTGDKLHGFKVEQVCNCNTCQQACDSSNGFKYTEPSILQGFNWPLVLSFYGFVGVATASITYYRHWRNKNKSE